MQRFVRVLIPCAALVAAACGDSARIPADLQDDLALAAASADLELASRPTDQTSVVGAAERTTPPARMISRSARAPRPRRSPTPQVRADVQPETEVVQEPEVAAAPQPMPAPVEEAPVEIIAASRPRAVEPAPSGGAGPDTRGGDWGTIIGIGGPVVIRGGGVGEDRCIPPTVGRGGTSISINERYPRRGGSGGVVMGGRTGGRVGMGSSRVGTSGRTSGGGSVMGGRTGGRQVVHSAPARPRHTGSIGSSPSARSRPMGNVGAGRGSPIGASSVAHVEEQ